MTRKPNINNIVRDLDPAKADEAVDAALEALAEGELAVGDPKRQAAIEALAKEEKAEQPSQAARSKL